MFHGASASVDHRSSLKKKKKSKRDQSWRDKSSSCCQESELMWESGICGTLVFCTVVGPITDRLSRESEGRLRCCR